jgi:SNF family Na+-dependent transporter
MRNQNSSWSTVASVSAFFIGVVLLWSFGKSWLDFESALVFLAGLVGVAVTVLLVAAWEIRKRSARNDK